MMSTAVASFVASRYGLPLAEVRVSLERLTAGLESAVARATVDTGISGVPRSVIVKQMRGRHQREAAVYRWIAGHVSPSSIVRVLGAQRERGLDYLFLEDLGSPGAWPWADMRVATEVCRILARIHRAPVPTADFADWDYESELTASAGETLDVAASARNAAGGRYWRRLGDLMRLVDYLPMLRECLAKHGSVVIHGDVHPNNVLMQTESGHSAPS